MREKLVLRPVLALLAAVLKPADLYMCIVFGEDLPSLFTGCIACLPRANSNSAELSPHTSNPEPMQTKKKVAA